MTLTNSSDSEPRTFTDALCTLQHRRQTCTSSDRPLNKDDISMGKVLKTKLTKSTIKTRRSVKKQSYTSYLVNKTTYSNCDYAREIRRQAPKINLDGHIFNHLKTKRRLLYLKTQSVPRCKQFSSRLQKPIRLCCKWHKSRFALR